MASTPLHRQIPFGVGQAAEGTKSASFNCFLLFQPPEARSEAGLFGWFITRWIQCEIQPS